MMTAYSATGWGGPLLRAGSRPGRQRALPRRWRRSTTAPPAFAVIDLKLGDGSGLDVIRALKDKRADARGVILTGYGAIATAVTAVKIGAFDYLAKPVNADDVVVALMAGRLDMPAEHEPLMSAARVRWEHIQRIFEDNGRNVSETARQLNMHRRTLQRILAKRAPK